MLAKLASLAAMGASATHVKLLRHFLVGLINTLMLIVFSAMMACLFVASCLFGFYEVLEYYGVESGTALGMIIALTFLCTALLVTLALRQLKQLRVLSDQAEIFDRTPFFRAADVLHAFIEGFINPPYKR